MGVAWQAKHIAVTKTSAIYSPILHTYIFPEVYAVYKIFHEDIVSFHRSNPILGNRLAPLPNFWS